VINPDRGALARGASQPVRGNPAADQKNGPPGECTVVGPANPMIVNPNRAEAIATRSRRSSVSCTRRTPRA